MPLTSTERRALRARAHKLKPVVQTGAAGLTDAVLAEAEIALEHHELIKIRLVGAEREDRAELAEEVCQRLKAEMVGQIGHVLILYRKAKPAKPAKAAKPAKPTKGKKPRS